MSIGMLNLIRVRGESVDSHAFYCLLQCALWFKLVKVLWIDLMEEINNAGLNIFINVGCMSWKICIGKFDYGLS